MDKTTPMKSKPLVDATCKLGTNGCYTDGRCYYVGECENKIITNADRIRAMSDEELAEYLVYHNPYSTESNCLKWLKKPADMRGDNNGRT